MAYMMSLVVEEIAQVPQIMFLQVLITVTVMFLSGFYKKMVMLLIS